MMAVDLSQSVLSESEILLKLMESALAESALVNVVSALAGVP